jgi:hypothetical protein
LAVYFWGGTHPFGQGFGTRISGVPGISLFSSVSASMTKPVSLHSGHGFFSNSMAEFLVHRCASLLNLIRTALFDRFEH